MFKPWRALVVPECRLNYGNENKDDEAFDYEYFGVK